LVELSPGSPLRSGFGSSPPVKLLTFEHSVGSSQPDRTHARRAESRERVRMAKPAANPHSEYGFSQSLPTRTGPLRPGTYSPHGRWRGHHRHRSRALLRLSPPVTGGTVRQGKTGRSPLHTPSPVVLFAPACGAEPPVVVPSIDRAHETSPTAFSLSHHRLPLRFPGWM